jgi:hypothetical protein
MRQTPSYTHLLEEANPDHGYFSFMSREKFVKTYSWSIPSLAGVQALKKFAGNGWVLEICSGYGLWGALLKKEQVTCFSTDLHVSGQHVLSSNVYCKHNLSPFTYIHNADAVDAVKRFPADVLFMSWPCYDEPFAYEALLHFKGNKLAYIGEGNGGCTANEDFYNELEANWEEQDVIHIPKWMGIHDSLRLYTRKASL